MSLPRIPVPSGLKGWDLGQGSSWDPARPPEPPCSLGGRMLRVRPGQPPMGYLGYQRDVAGLGHSSPALQPRGKREGAGTGKGLGRSSGAAGFWGESLGSLSRDWEGRVPSAPHPCVLGCFPRGNGLERGSRCSRCAPCGTQDLSWHSCGTQDLSMSLGVGSHSRSKDWLIQPGVAAIPGSSRGRQDGAGGSAWRPRVGAEAPSGSRIRGRDGEPGIAAGSQIPEDQQRVRGSPGRLELPPWGFLGSAGCG